MTGAVAFANGRVYVPVSSMEEGTAVIPSYECCTFRGSVNALDAATRQSDLEDVHRQRDAAKDDEDRSRHAAVGSVGRRRLVDARARSGSQPDVRRDGRQLLEPSDESERRDHGACDGHRPRALGPADAGRRLMEHRMSRARQTAWGARTVRASRGPITTSPARPCSRRPAEDDAFCWLVRSQGCCTASTPTPATTSGRRRSATAACSAASNGDLPSTARARTSRCRARSRRNPEKPAAWPPSISPTARSNGGRRRRQASPAVGAPDAARASRPPSARFPAWCSRRVSTATFADTKPRRGRSSSTPTRCRSSPRSTA